MEIAKLAVYLASDGARLALEKGPQDPRFTLIEKRMRHVYLDCLP